MLIFLAHIGKKNTQIRPLLKCWYFRRYSRQKKIFWMWFQKNVNYLEMLIFSEIWIKTKFSKWCQNKCQNNVIFFWKMKTIFFIYNNISFARTPEIGQGLGRSLRCGARKQEWTYDSCGLRTTTLFHDILILP